MAVSLRLLRQSSRLFRQLTVSARSLLTTHPLLLADTTNTPPGGGQEKQEAQHSDTRQDYTAGEHTEQDIPHQSSDSHEDYEHDIRDRILSRSLDFVHTHGWTSKALAAGASAEGLPQVAHGLFPRGGVELINHFYISCNRTLAENLALQVQAQEEGTVEKKKISVFIRDAVEMRLRLNIPYIDTWAQAMAIMALPQNAPDGWSNLAALVDDIWHYAGDTSTDSNWYTKRLTLGAVYKSTELCMLQDRSEDYIDTWNFLDRRMGDMVTIGKTIRQCSQAGGVMNEAVTGVMHLTKNVLGMNDRFR